MSIDGIKVTTRKIDDDPTGGYIGAVHLPSGQVISTCRTRKGRTSAREDAVRLAASLSDDGDIPLSG